MQTYTQGMKVSYMDEEVVLLHKLETLRERHQELDGSIRHIESSAQYDEFTIRRLKKEKLAVKDQILRIEEILYPDIIA